MSDLISKQAVLDELEKLDWQDLYLPIHFKQILDNVPSVENKGEWIYQEGVTPYKWRCNKCEKMFKTDFNYCPNCGADMRGKSCSTCRNSDDEFSGECYECLKGIFDHYEAESEADFPQAEDIEPTVKSFSKVLDNKLIRDAIRDCDQT